MKTRFRSKYASFRFGGPVSGNKLLTFNNHVAETEDAALIAATKSAENFGEGRDFWIDVALPTAKAKGGKDGKGDGDDSGEKTEAPVKPEKPAK